MFKIVTEEVPDLLTLTLLHTGWRELLVAGLWALWLGHLRQPLHHEGVTVGLAYVVQNAAGQDHSGHHVQSTVVPLAQTLPACPQSQQRLIGHTVCSGESTVKEPLWLRQCSLNCPPASLLRIRLQQPALEGVTGLAQQHIPGHHRWFLVSYRPENTD